MRNPQMTEKMHAMMLNDPTLLHFFFNGYMHLVDSEITGDGEVSLLRQKGWTVTQI